MTLKLNKSIKERAFTCKVQYKQICLNCGRQCFGHKCLTPSEAATNFSDVFWVNLFYAANSNIPQLDHLFSWDPQFKIFKMPVHKHLVIKQI